MIEINTMDIIFYILSTIALLGVIICMSIDIASSYKVIKLNRQIKDYDQKYKDVVLQEMPEELLTAISLISGACLYRISLLKDNDTIDNLERLILTKAWQEVRIKLINELKTEIETSNPNKYSDIYGAIQQIIRLIQSGELTPKTK